MMTSSRRPQPPRLRLPEMLFLEPKFPPPSHLYRLQQLWDLALRLLPGHQLVLRSLFLHQRPICPSLCITLQPVFPRPLLFLRTVRLRLHPSLLLAGPRLHPSLLPAGPKLHPSLLPIFLRLHPMHQVFLRPLDHLLSRTLLFKTHHNMIAHSLIKFQVECHQHQILQLNQLSHTGFTERKLLVGSHSPT